MSNRRRVVGEFVLIVVGVFAALMLETMMSERHDGELRDEYLSRLETDVTTDKQTIEHRIAFFTGVQTFSQEFFDWLHSDAPVNQSILLAAFYAAEIWPYAPATSTYQDLQSTGNLRLLDNIDLRTSLFRYHNKANTSRPGWNPSDEYRRTIRGIIPSDIQTQIRNTCPTADLEDQKPTGFPPCELHGIDYAQLATLFEPLRQNFAFQEILTYRHSELGVMLRLFHQQITFADDLLVRVRE